MIGMEPDTLSPNERRIFETIDPCWIEIVEKGQTFVPVAINFLAIRAFADHQEGPAVEALRRAVRHLEAGKFRGNPEYEALIGF